MQITRIAKLAIYPNFGKLEGARYTHARHLQYAQHWVTQLYFNRGVKSFSTAGMGQLANQAQHKAKGILEAHFAAVKETGDKSNVPQIRQTGCPARIEKSETSCFDYWVRVEDTFTKMGGIFLPVKSHKRLNQWLRRGYTLNPTAEFHKDKNGKFYIIVFVQKEIPEATQKKDCFGVDVGTTHTVAREDGYLGRGCKDLLTQNRDQNAERRRQGHLTVSAKTFMKQVLDIEAGRAVRVALNGGWNLALEDPKILANLKPRGRIAMWASAYFARRVSTLAEELGVFVVIIHPAYTSRTCAKCFHCDELSRVKSVFTCTNAACESRTHADIPRSLIKISNKHIFQKMAA